MKIKTNLHLHTSDDPEDAIDYDFYEAMDRAAALGFGAVALTCHNKFIDNPDYGTYALKLGLLLIRGIEKEVEDKHVVILNADKATEDIETFEELAEYKKRRPEIFILAPHPYFLASYCLGKNLNENIALFDAVEYSWFYSKMVNLNKKAEAIAQKNDLPFIAASDTHRLEFLDKSYAVIEIEEKNPAALFEAVRNGKFQNVSAPSKFWREMIWSFVTGEIKKRLPRKKR